MTDTGGGDVVDDVVVTGQRRRYAYEGFPIRNGLENVGEPGNPPSEVSEDTGIGGEMDPCADPETARDWNADAAGAETAKDLDEYSRSNPPTGGRGFNEREYGAGLWEMPDGTVVRGPMRHSEQTFAEAAAAAANGGIGRPFVVIDWTPPAPGAVPIGSVHSHGPEGRTPSGNLDDLTIGDVGHLFGVMQMRAAASGIPNGNQARIYIVSRDFGQYETEGPIRINVYDERNIEAAIGGVEGPEVNPDGQSCGGL